LCAGIVAVASGKGDWRSCFKAFKNVNIHQYSVCKFIVVVVKFRGVLVIDNTQM